MREDVPRHVWVKTTAKGNRIGNGSTSIRGLLASQHKLTTANIRLLQQVGVGEFDDLDVGFSPESLNTWAKRACVINTGKNDYREEVITKLTSEGYKLVEPNEDDLEDVDSARDSIIETCQQNYKTYCQAVPKVETPTDSELEELSNKKAKTEDERLRERKGNLGDF